MANRVAISSSVRKGIQLSFPRLPKSLRQLSATAEGNGALPPLKFYQYQICPFCNKVKAFLSYAGITYEPVEVNPLTKDELKPWSGDYLKVPIAKIGDEQINGSDEIIQKLLKDSHLTNKLETRWSRSSDNQDGSAMTMDDFALNDEVQKWTQFSNEQLAPILYPNICRSLAESYAAFGYVSEISSFTLTQKFMIRSIGSLAMYFAASRIKSKRNITNEREALHSVLSDWEKDALDMGSKNFSSGLSQPSLGDIAMFGTLYSVQGLDAHTDAIKGRGGVIQRWYEQMHREVRG